MILSTEARLVMASLALYFVAYVLATKDGPWGIINDFRLQIANLDVWDGERDRFKFGFEKLVTCPYCLGVYLALPVLGLAFIQTLPSDIALSVLAILGGQYVALGVTHGS